MANRPYSPHLLTLLSSSFSRLSTFTILNTFKNTFLSCIKQLHRNHIHYFLLLPFSHFSNSNIHTAPPPTLTSPDPPSITLLLPSSPYAPPCLIHEANPHVLIRLTPTDALSETKSRAPIDIPSSSHAAKLPHPRFKPRIYGESPATSAEEKSWKCVPCLTCLHVCPLAWCVVVPSLVFGFRRRRRAEARGGMARGGTGQVRG